MLIVFFLAALASGALTLWLMWSHGLVVALIAAAIAASAVAGLLAVAFAIFRRPAGAGDEQRTRGVLDFLGPRQPR